MPFTASHPAAVIGLRRTGLPMTALVIGSMVPDLPLFGLAPWSYARSHSRTGIVTVDIVAGVVVIFAWTLLRAPVNDLGPRRLRGGSHPGHRPRRILSRTTWLTVPAVVLGAITHVVWDEFTHDGRWGARHVPWLAHEHGGLAGYKWCQYLSGVLGAAVVVVSSWRWLRDRPPLPPGYSAAPSTRLALRMAVVIGVLATLSVTAQSHIDEGRHALYASLTDAGPAVAIVLLLVAIGWHVAEHVHETAGHGHL